MTKIDRQRWFSFGAGLFTLLFFVSLGATPVMSRGASTQPRFEYRVIEVPPDTRSLQSALDEYGHSGWELVAFEMGELQMPRLIFKKGTLSSQ
ncbi:MAG: DUF4177 domain-containing protein [Nitrospira sp.]|nr:DUF4177 domain-containing protein [Nitrospira sp.]